MFDNRGGARVGAGRPRGDAKPKLLAACPPGTEPLTFLLSIMNDGDVDIRLRIVAAKAALPFTARTAGAGKGSDSSMTPPEDDAASWAVLLDGKR